MVVNESNVGDVEMKNVGDGKPEVVEPVAPNVQQQIREHFRQIEKAVASKEPRLIMRSLRYLPSTRRKLNGTVLSNLVNQLYVAGVERDTLSQYIVEEVSEGVGAISTTAGTSSNETAAPVDGVRKAAPTKPPVLEVELYLHLLMLLRLIDVARLDEALNCSNALMAKITQQNRRTADYIAAKCYFYHSRVVELTDKLDSIRSFLHTRLRTCTLRNDFEGQAVLINCLLRNYLHYSLYDQADKLVTKCVFPETASNNEWARFLYYLGRIKAARLEYSVAHKHLVQSIRKAPQNAAVGFRQTVQKLLVVVELLLGDIPERQVFRHAHMRTSLGPYFQLTQAVRMGNLQRFGEVLENFAQKFQQDHTFTLILRLRHNVIKTAIRAIAMSYSRITSQDIARKLCLDTAEDAEFIVAKAIKDGVIEATLDAQGSWMRSKETSDIYCTKEPQMAFHQRISFCLDLHNQSVKAMRYPPKAYGKELESAEERREREQQDLELAKEMAEEDDDGFP